MILYTLFVMATGLERLYELRISRTNARIATDNGGKDDDVSMTSDTPSRRSASNWLALAFLFFLAALSGGQV